MPLLTTSRTLVLTVLVMSACLLPGCKRASEALAEKAIEQASGEKVDIKQDGGNVSIQTDQGELKIATADAGGSVALPDGFPDDVHLPVQRKISSAMDMAGMKMVNLDTSTAPDAVAAEVEKHMQAQGWKREMSMQATGGSTLVYSKDKRQAVFQMVKSDAGGTQLAVRTGSGE